MVTLIIFLSFVNAHSLGAVGSIIEGYPSMPILPFEFNGSSDIDSLWNCSKSIIKCSKEPYKYTAVTCQGEMFNLFEPIILH